MSDQERDPSMPPQMPGQGPCPPGYRLSTQPSQPGSSYECNPIGPNIPLGGWKPAAPGFGAGYPHSPLDTVNATARDAFDALYGAIMGG